MFGDDVKSFHSASTVKPAVKHEVVDRAIDYIKNNYNKHISLDTIVSDMFFSKEYFRQLFKRVTGTSVTDFIQKTRIEAAINLIETTDRTIFEIAGECGFADVKFFYKTFKKITGKTPKQYRAQEGEANQ